MHNIFDTMPEFISSDVRVKRPVNVSYRIDSDFMMRRHQAMLPKELIDGATVLDLGSAASATGAYALFNGASYYTAVEIQPKMATDAAANLSKYFDQARFDVMNTSIEAFLDNDDRLYDIIIVSGVIYGIIDYFGFIKKLSIKAKKCIIIESMHPWKILREDGSMTPMAEWVNAIRYPIVQYAQTIRHSHEDGTKSYEYDGIRISISAFSNIFGHIGWKVSTDANDILAATIPDVYDVNTVVNMDPSNPGQAHLSNIASGPRFLIHCYPNNKSKFDFLETFNKPINSIPFKQW